MDVLTGNADRENATRQSSSAPSTITRLDELKVVLHRAAYLRTLETDAEHHQKPSEATTRFEDILGNAPAMREIFPLVPRVAKTDVTGLLQAESGTGTILF